RPPPSPTLLPYTTLFRSNLTGNVTFNESADYLLRVYGSVVLNPNVTMNAMLYFTGEEDVTFTNKNSTGTLEVRVYKSGPAADIGTVSFVDDWSNAKANEVWVRGDVDEHDRVLDIHSLIGRNKSMGGHLNRSDAGNTVHNSDFLNPTKTVDAAGSYILSKNVLAIRTGSFCRVESSPINGNPFDIAHAAIDFVTL